MIRWVRISWQISSASHWPWARSTTRAAQQRHQQALVAASKLIE
jgi:hypothetical protein